MPSVTTVLRDDSKFDGWRKYQGEKKANAILQAASARGTWTHDSADIIACGLMKSQIFTTFTSRGGPRSNLFWTRSITHC